MAECCRIFESGEVQEWFAMTSWTNHECQKMITSLKFECSCAYPWALSKVVLAAHKASKGSLVFAVFFWFCEMLAA